LANHVNGFFGLNLGTISHPYVDILESS